MKIKVMPKKYLTTAADSGNAQTVTEKTVIGFCSPDSRRTHTATIGGFFASITAWFVYIGQAVRGAARLAGSSIRSANPHSLPFLRFAAQRVELLTPSRRHVMRQKNLFPLPELCPICGGYKYKKSKLYPQFKYCKKHGIRLHHYDFTQFEPMFCAMSSVNLFLNYSRLFNVRPVFSPGLDIHMDLFNILQDVADVFGRLRGLET